MNVSHQKRRFSEGMEYKMNKYSRVMEAKSVQFSWKQPLGLGFFSISDVLDKTENGDVVNVQGKVVSKSSSEKVYSRFMQKDLMKCDIVIADSTGVINVTVWEKQIKKVEVYSYNFKKMKVQYFKRRYLNAVKDSEVEICQDVDISHDKLSEIKEKVKVVDEQVFGNVLAADISKMYICLNCKGRIVDANASILKCNNCLLRMKKENLVCIPSANLFIKEVQDDGEGNALGRYFCPTNVLQAVFTALSTAEGYNIGDPDISKLESDMMIDSLLNIKKLIVNREDKIVKEAKLV